VGGSATIGRPYGYMHAADFDTEAEFPDLKSIPVRFWYFVFVCCGMHFRRLDSMRGDIRLAIVFKSELALDL